MARKLMLSMIVLGGAFLPTALQAETCESLSKLVSPTVSITLANTIDSGTFTPLGSTMSFPHLPGFCRVTASLKPTSDSDIRIEVWLPIADWNGKFLAVGSGGWGGFINYNAMAVALRRGYSRALSLGPNSVGLVSLGDRAPPIFS
jgi:feruloyl esterase